ncbi:MAG: Flp pilus assembly complex ATPase component TadA [Firmicutes bacterium]|nr:Flp pilus assembly complex ATPase component TadA [Bacillota bacterium]
MAAMPAAVAQPRPLGHVISILGSKGGVGKTTVATALGTALSEKGHKVVLVDLTLRLGSDLVLALGLDADRSFADLIPDIHSLEPTSIENYLLTHTSGMRILAAPNTPDKWQRVQEGHVEKTIHLLRYRYDYVIVDLAGGFDNRVLAVLPISDKIVALLTPERMALQNMQSLAKLMRLLGYITHTVVVLNKWTGKEMLSIPEMEQLIGTNFAHVIPEISAKKTRAHDLIQGNANTEMTKGLSPLVDALVEGPKKENTSTSGGWIFPLISGFIRQDSKKEECVKVKGHVVEHEVQNLVHSRVIEHLGPTYLEYRQNDSDPTMNLRVMVMQVIDDVIKDEVGDAWNQARKHQFRQDMLDEILGLGHLEALLRDPQISEIMVNGAKQIYVEEKGQLILTEKQFTNDAAVTKIIERIIAPIGRRIDESSPMVDARLADGSRVNAVIPPLALNGPMLTIRKFHNDSLGIDELIQFGSLDETVAAFLKQCVKARFNLIVSGGTGSGKTTLLNVLSSFIPGGERVLTIEDAAELELRQSHVARLEARPPNIEGKGAVTIRDLLRNALRMRPDRIIIGEVRGQETLDMLQAMNTGHDGSMTTAHANSPKDLLSRLETMVMMGGIELPLSAIREQIAAALDVIVQQSRLRDGSRKITEIAWVEGMEEDSVKLAPLFIFRQGKFQQREFPPAFKTMLEDRGLTKVFY